METDWNDDDLAVFRSDPEHPDWADYIATNLLDALEQVPDTGDWHAAVKGWCERTMTGRLTANRQTRPSAY